MSHVFLAKSKDHLLVFPTMMPNDEEFELWARIFLHHNEISQLTFEQGADRHLMRFQFNRMQFGLNFEHYSDSVWISPEEHQASAHLSSLLAILNNN